MKIGILHSGSNKVDPAKVAQHMEGLGFESYWLGEHVVVPEEFMLEKEKKKSETTKTAEKELTTQKEIKGEDYDHDDSLWQTPDPLVMLARVGAVTKTLKVGTSVCIVPYRNPIVLAKQVATLDHCCDGRFLFGIGGGWMRGEFDLFREADFEHRWTQTKDYVAAMKELWTQPVSHYNGKYVQFPPIRCFPKPAHKPYPPILLASTNNPKAAQRVVDWADGWIPIVQSIQEFKDGLSNIKGKALASGRDLASLDFTVCGLKGQWRSYDDQQRFADAGAHRLNLLVGAQTLDETKRELDAIAKEHIR